MGYVAIQFPTVYDLWNFRRETGITLFDIVNDPRTIICECTDEEINLAITKYQGKVTVKESNHSQRAS